MKTKKEFIKHLTNDYYIYRYVGNELIQFEIFNKYHDTFVSGVFMSENYCALINNKFLAGEDYSIADIATWPWIARHLWHDIGLKNYEYLCKWYETISKRPAVAKGYKFMDENSEIPKP